MKKAEIENIMEVKRKEARTYNFFSSFSSPYFFITIRGLVRLQCGE